MHLQFSSSRRTFLNLATGSLVGGSLALWRSPALAIPLVSEPAVLSGTEFDLAISEVPVNITGSKRRATLINGSLPGPTLRWREGDVVTLRVRNQLDVPTSIHWHGIVLPTDMDGVPGLSFHGIAPGETFTYRFKVKQHGTYWYHSHSGLQEQTGVYGPLIIEPRDPEPARFDRDYVVMLSDWTDEEPERIKAKLKKQSDYYNFHKRTVVDFIGDVRQKGLAPTVEDRWMWSTMRMNPTDLSDVSGYTYTYLMNGLGPGANWTATFRPGERVRLRFINGSAMTYFDVRIPGLQMTVVAADGQPVRPVKVDEFRMAVAETFDVIVEPTAGTGAYTIFAQSIDRTGSARGTLALRSGMQGPTPALDPRPLLGMSDMGMDHGSMAGMDHGSMEGMSMDSMQSGAMQSHPQSEFNNPLVDMQAMSPAAKLDDPGIGLRDNGRRVLTYSDLHSAFNDPDGREPSRTIELHLTGHMEKFAWSFDGVKFADSLPIKLRYGERVRVVLVNDTMMGHPIHLHGMWSDLEDDQGRFMVRKHTIDMPPGTRRSYRVTADALGRWAYHCHLMYHMETGMFREVRVEE